MLEKNIAWKEKDGIKYITFHNLDHPGLYAQGVTSRIGGVSQPPYTGLNLGYYVNDRDKNVVENRKKMRRALQLNHTKMITSDQIHSNKIFVVSEKVNNGGWEDPRRAIRMSDALITKLSNVTLTITTADCVPVLIYDPRQKVIAAVHAGWKGTGLSIAAKTILKMKETFRVNPVDCQVAFGPSIGVCCYSVDIKVIDFFRSKFSYWRELFKLEKNTFGKLNLIEANRRQLVDVGVLDKNISSSGLCTSCNNDSFFSFRKENANTGRQMAFITLARS